MEIAAARSLASPAELLLLLLLRWLDCCVHGAAVAGKVNHLSHPCLQRGTFIFSTYTAAFFAVRFEASRTIYGNLLPAHWGGCQTARPSCMHACVGGGWPACCRGLLPCSGPFPAPRSVLGTVLITHLVNQWPCSSAYCPTFSLILHRHSPHFHAALYVMQVDVVLNFMTGISVPGEERVVYDLRRIA